MRMRRRRRPHLRLLLSVATVLIRKERTPSFLFANAFAKAPSSQPRPTRSRRGGASSRDALRRTESDGEEGEDWRDFRAKLIRQEGDRSRFDGDDGNDSARSSEEWAYETTGALIERGSVILSRPKPAFGGGLLRHPFWHKAVMLILEHDDRKETLGIFLNRPTDMVKFDDADGRRDEAGWRIWYGGPVHSGLKFADDMAEVLCLHSISSMEARRISTKVVRGIQYTTFENATSLVKSGMATPDDFWVFAGYCGWSEGQLKREMDDQSWMAMASDSGTLLRELQEQATNARPESAGMDIWNNFAVLIGKNGRSSDASNAFDDLLLKEWARKELVHAKEEDAENEMAFSGREVEIGPGTLLRARAHPRSPFLLSDQDMHKCIFLVVSENAYGTVGVILNLPSAKTVSLNVTDVASNFESPSIQLLLRYGGNYVVFGEGERPLLWLHCNDRLRRSRVGIPLDDFNADGVWECAHQDVASAIRDGIASPADFMVVSGGYIWVKDNEGKTGGMRGEVWNGRFELIPAQNGQQVWDTLLAQGVTTAENLDKNLATSSLAWDVAAVKEDDTSAEKTVFGSNVKLAQLEDEARRRWVAKYILNDPVSIA